MRARSTNRTAAEISSRCSGACARARRAKSRLANRSPVEGTSRFLIGSRQRSAERTHRSGAVHHGRGFCSSLGAVRRSLRDVEATLSQYVCDGRQRVEIPAATIDDSHDPTQQHRRVVVSLRLCREFLAAFQTAVALFIRPSVVTTFARCRCSRPTSSCRGMAATASGQREAAGRHERRYFLADLRSKCLPAAERMQTVPPSFSGTFLPHRWR